MLSKIEEEILDALIELKKSGPTEKSYGICYHVNELVSKDLSTGFVYDKMNLIALGWEHHSGEKSYPIPSTKKKIKSASEYYDKWVNRSLWTHKQGTFRRSLIDYMINKLQS